MTVAEELAREFYAWAEDAADRVPESTREQAAIEKLTQVFATAYDRGGADTRAQLLDGINKKIGDLSSTQSPHVVNKVAVLADLRAQIERRA